MHVAAPTHQHAAVRAELQRDQALARGYREDRHHPPRGDVPQPYVASTGVPGADREGRRVRAERERCRAAVQLLRDAADDVEVRCVDQPDPVTPMPWRAGHREHPAVRAHREPRPPGEPGPSGERSIEAVTAREIPYDDISV